MRRFKLAPALFAGVSALAFPFLVAAEEASSAQQGAAPGAAQAASPAAASDKPTTTVREITVTGSRLIKNGDNSPTPLTTVNTQTLQTAAPAGTIIDALNDLPVFSGSRNQFSNPGSNATGVQGGNGAADVLNLRNLGAYRTLVLYDGHRIPPTLFNSTVDVDLIPQELIQRVDVVTGGVSAVYGSDAVSGVVNFVANRHFEGFQGHAEYGISQQGDDATTDVGLAFGTDLFGGRGHFEGSYQYRDNDGILWRSSRSWDNLAAVEGAGTKANPYHLVTGVHLAAYTFGGLVTSGALSGQQFGSNGVLSPFQAGGATGSSCCQIGGSGAYQNASMVSPMTSHQLFGRFDYDFSNNLHGFVVLAANLKNNTSYNGWNTLANYVFSANNAFLPSAYQATLANAHQASFKLSDILNQAPRIENSTNTDQYYLNAGLEGSVWGYKWDLTYTHGTSNMDTREENIFNNQHLAAALDATTNASGQVVCRASLTNSAYSNCTPLDVFGPSAASQAALKYVLATVDFKTQTNMDAVDASFRGTPFNDWAGPVGVAISGEWRRQTFDASSNGLPTQYADCTDLTYNCSATTTLYSTTFPSSGTVEQSVGEGAIEVEAPLLKDVFLAKSIDFNGAIRFTDYSTSGSYVTWKVGGVWAVNDEFKIRVTNSRDIRAPTLYDLYQPKTIVPGNFTDTLTGVSSYVPSINLGNPNLKSEVGYTFTGGFVYQPHFLPGASLSVDTYHTIIRNAITTVQGFNAAIQQACYTSGGSSPYCGLITRPGPVSDTSASNAATAYYIEPENIAKVWTYGEDVEADYTHRVFGRRLDVRVFVTYQPHIYYEQPGVATIDQGDAGWGTNGLMPSPSTQVAAFVDYQLTNKLKVDLFEHYRNAMHRSGVLSQVWSDPIIPSFATTNVTFTYDLGDALKIKDSSLFFSVTNLFDAHPPLEGYYSGASSAGAAYEYGDDPEGRGFVVGFRVRN